MKYLAPLDTNNPPKEDGVWLSPSIHKFDEVFIYSGLSAARDEPLGLESFDLEAVRLRAHGRGALDRLEA